MLTNADCTDIVERLARDLRLGERELFWRETPYSLDAGVDAGAGGGIHQAVRNYVYHILVGVRPDFGSQDRLFMANQRREAGIERALRDAFRGESYLEPGWRVIGDAGAGAGAGAGDIRLTKNGVFLRAGRDEISTDDASEGDTVSVRIPAVWPFFSPGFVSFVGAAGPPSGAVPPVRGYIHASTSGASTVVSLVGRHLNAAGVCFFMKAANHAAGYERADSIVVSIDPAGLATLAEAMAELASGHRGDLQESRPILTMPAGPGMGIAQEPLPDGGPLVSFNQHRANLIAEGLVEAAIGGDNSESARREAIVGAFEAAGVDYRRPWCQEHASGQREEPFAEGATQTETAFLKRTVMKRNVSRQLTDVVVAHTDGTSGRDWPELDEQARSRLRRRAGRAVLPDHSGAGGAEWVYDGLPPGTTLGSALVSDAVDISRERLSASAESVGKLLGLLHTDQIRSWPAREPAIAAVVRSLASGEPLGYMDAGAWRAVETDLIDLVESLDFEVGETSSPVPLHGNPGAANIWLPDAVSARPLLIGWLQPATGPPGADLGYLVGDLGEVAVTAHAHGAPQKFEACLSAIDSVISGYSSRAICPADLPSWAAARVVEHLVQWLATFGLDRSAIAWMREVAAEVRLITTGAVRKARKVRKEDRARVAS